MPSAEHIKACVLAAIEAGHQAAVVAAPGEDLCSWNFDDVVLRVPRYVRSVDVAAWLTESGRFPLGPRESKWFGRCWFVLTVTQRGASGGLGDARCRAQSAFLKAAREEANARGMVDVVRFEAFYHID